uniref:Retroviral polymerase SH3-like domain-containing protein n=1 Tax=Cannabis sativa TaxID=3483 RepID=A0A803NFN3_CANSA
MRTAVDLIILSPSVLLNGDVHDRVWRGKNVSYDHLRVFECRAFVLIPKDERSKLNDKAKLCIFLGYGHAEFGYILWDPLNKKIIRSKDAVFLEDQMFEDSDKVQKKKSHVNVLVSTSAVPSPIVHDDHEGDEQKNYKEHVNKKNILFTEIFGNRLKLY